MKITDYLIRQLEIAEVPGLDSIRVSLQDISPGKGRVTIECYGQAWSTYWGAMGENNTISSFFASVSDDYIVDRMVNIDHRVLDPEKLQETVLKTIIKDRRDGELSASEARYRWDRVDELDEVKEIKDLHLFNDLVFDLMGDDWWNKLPMKPNPDYLYLKKIVGVVQEALRGNDETRAAA